MNIKIRPLEEADAKTSVHWRNDPEIWRHTGSAPDHHITLEDEQIWIRKVIADDSSRRFAILADDQYVGNVYLTGISAGEGEYHIFIGNKSFWGRGVAKAASIQLFDHARTVLGLKSIRLSVKKSNQSALPLYAKLGFQSVSTEGESVKMKLTL